VHHPHNVERNSFADVAGTPMPAPAPKFSATPGAAGPISEVGGATADLLAELGYTAAQVEQLRSAGAIA
jgi:alpha-methylacyl-CoA racemase